MNRLILIIMIFASLDVSARNMKQLLSEMPEHVMPILSRNNVLDLLDFSESKMKAEVENKYGGKTSMKFLSKNFCEIEMTEASFWQIKLIENNGDSLICISRTFKAGNRESEIKFYSINWKEDNKKRFVTPSLSDFIKAGTEKRKVVDIKRFIPVAYIVCCLSEEDQKLRFRLSTETLSREELETVTPSIINEITSGIKF